MYTDNRQIQPASGTTYSYFTNEYTLTKEMCAEAELSRIDIGLSYVCMTAVFVLLVFLSSVPEILPSLPDAARAYFASPSTGTILQFSGVAGITFVSPVVVIFCFLKIFPKLVGEKRFNEHMKLVPSANRTLSFYEDYITVQGKFSKKLPYRELKRTGETRHLYLLYFTEKRILIVDKNRFRKGNLKDLKQFIRERRTKKSKIYGVVRCLPLVLLFFLFCFCLWVG